VDHRFPGEATAGKRKEPLGERRLLVCEPEVFDDIPEMAPSDLSLDVMPTLAHRERGLRGHCLGSGERVMWNRYNR